MVDIKKLKSLRLDTGVSLALCKKALEETNNDLIKAKKLLTRWGAETVANKAGRSVHQGAIFSYVHHNKKVASLIELLCETDFVASNQDFLTLGQELAMQLASLPVDKPEALLAQNYIRDQSKTVNELIQEAVMKFGENIKIGRMVRWSL